MNKEERLVALYLYVCRRYDTELGLHCQRFSNHHNPVFTDQEVITIFLFAMLEDEKFTTKQMHSHIKKYWLSWFPRLPGYQQFNKRLNRLVSVFPVLLSSVLSEVELDGVDLGTSLGDSMPIVLAQRSRSYSAKVAPELCNQGYCASKKLTYYGVKLHTLGFRREKALPLPEYLQLTPASQHDLSAMRQIFSQLSNRQLFLDKAYCDKQLAEELIEQARVTLYTPRKKKKGEQDIGADGRLISTAVSRVRQPIESFFNWIDQKTGIQSGAKIRSRQGLLVHVFGRLTAAMILLCLPIFN